MLVRNTISHIYEIPMGIGFIIIFYYNNNTIKSTREEIGRCSIAHMVNLFIELLIVLHFKYNM